MASIRKYIVLGFAITTVLVTAKILFEKTSWGYRFEMWAFELLQKPLTSFNPEESLPVVVIDISDIGEGKDEEIIDLDKLKEVVEAIAKEQPRVIGIDAVLTPELNDPDDPLEAEKQARREKAYFDFLDFCLQKIKEEKGIPIFLGVGARSIEGSGDWLGGEKYKELAATVAIPKESETRSIPVWFKGNAESEKLYSLSASLAKSYQLAEPPGWATWALESTEEQFPGSERHLDEKMEYVSAFINYSKLEAIRETRLFTISQTSIKESGAKFYNRMVILGDGTKAIDTFRVVGRDNDVFAGVYVHASAAYTFTREPLQELKCWFRILLDFALSAVIIFCVALFRYRHRHDASSYNWKKLQTRLVVSVLLLVFILAILLVSYSGILWLDFLIVMLALWLHPKVEHLLFGERP